MLSDNSCNTIGLTAATGGLFWLRKLLETRVKHLAGYYLRVSDHLCLPMRLTTFNVLLIFVVINIDVIMW